MRVIQDEVLFFNALTRKRHLEKSAAGVGLAADGAIAAESVKTAISGAYVTKVVGGVTVPALVPKVGGMVLFGQTVTEFSMAALLAAINPALLAAVGVSGALCLYLALRKKQPLTDKDLTSIGDDMGNMVAKLIFIPVMMSKVGANDIILFRNLRETMIYDFGYSEEFADFFMNSYGTKTLPQLEMELKNTHKELASNKDLNQIYKKFDIKRIQKFAQRRIDGTNL